MCVTTKAGRMANAGRTAVLISCGIPILIALSYCALALSKDLRLSPLLPVVAGVVVLLLGGTLVLAKRHAPHWRPGVVLALAVAFRLIFLFRPPELSDDIYRYLWDGDVMLSGHNPYASAPAQMHAATPDLARLQAHVNHSELVTIYPPAAQLLFASGRALGGSALGMKALLVALDLAACVVLLLLLRSAGLPQWRLALYAWHPLPILEVAGSGHIDGAAVFFMLLAVIVLVRPIRVRVAAAAAAGAIFAASVLTKLVPLVLLPAVLGLCGQRRSVAFLLAGTATAAALTAAFLPDIRNMLGTLFTYARHWEFASFAFRTLRQAIGSGDTSRILLAGGFVLSCVILYGSRGDRSHLEPALRRAYAVVIALLLLVPTLHPWYALYLVALLPFAAGPFGLALSGSVFLGYRVLGRYVTEHRWVDSSATAAAIIAVPLLVLFLQALVARRQARQPARGADREAPHAR
jgi:hypothetical protein